VNVVIKYAARDQVEGDPNFPQGVTGGRDSIVRSDRDSVREPKGGQGQSYRFKREGKLVQEGQKGIPAVDVKRKRQKREK